MEMHAARHEFTGYWPVLLYSNIPDIPFDSHSRLLYFETNAADEIPKGDGIKNEIKLSQVSFQASNTHCLPPTA